MARDFSMNVDRFVLYCFNDRFVIRLVGKRSIRTRGAGFSPVTVARSRVVLLAKRGHRGLPVPAL